MKVPAISLPPQFSWVSLLPQVTQDRSNIEERALCVLSYRTHRAKMHPDHSEAEGQDSWLAPELLGPGAVLLHTLSTLQHKPRATSLWS